FASIVASIFFSVATWVGLPSPPTVFLMELSISIVHPDILYYLGYTSGNGSLYLICNPDVHLGGRNVFFLAHKDPDKDIVLNALERLGQVPGVCIQITAFQEFVNSKPPELTWLSPEVRYVNDGKGFCGLGVKESKDEMRPT